MVHILSRVSILDFLGFDFSTRFDGKCDFKSMRSTREDRREVVVVMYLQCCVLVVPIDCGSGTRFKCGRVCGILHSSPQSLQFHMIYSAVCFVQTNCAQKSKIDVRKGPALSVFEIDLGN